jgi:hypothetical protein
MTDYSKYEVPSPNWYHSPLATCMACLKTVIEDSEFTVKDLLEAIEKHEPECDPKVWLYRHGYVQDIGCIDGTANRYERWFTDEPMTESEKVAKESEVKGYAPSDSRLVEFARRYW